MASADSSTKQAVTRIQSHGKIFKIIVIGDSNVGKTTLTYRFCEGVFLDKSEATIGVDFRSRTVDVDGEDVTLQLWDTAGQERYRMSMIRHYYRNAHAIILVYDVTNAASFDALKRWIEESNNNCLQDVPRILVGNKCDGVAVVTRTVAQQFADQNNMPLFETSARLDSQCDNVESIFMTLAHKLKNRKSFITSYPSIQVTSAPTQPQTSEKSSWCC